MTKDGEQEHLSRVSEGARREEGLCVRCVYVQEHEASP